MRGMTLERSAAMARTYVTEVIFVMSMLLSFALSRVPLVTPDSGGYLRAGEAFSGSGASGVGDAVTWGGISLSGNAFRGWPAALFYAVVPAGDVPMGMWGRSALQTALICGLTIWLAVEASRHVAGARALVLRSAIYLFALTPTALTYTFLVGAEATTAVFVLAGTAFVLASLRWINASMSMTVGAATVGGTFLLFLLGTLVRPSTVVLLVAATGLTCALVLRALAGTISRARALAFAGSVIVLLGAGLTYSLEVQSNTSKTWGTTTERAYRAFHAVDPAKNPAFFREFRERLPGDAPDCLRSYPDQPLDWAGMGSHGTGVCGPTGLAWIEDNYIGMLAGAYLSSPRFALSYFVRTGGEGAVQQGQSVDVVSVSPPMFDSLVFVEPGVQRWNLPLFYLVMFIVAAIGLVASTTRIRRTRGSSMALGRASLLAVMGASMWVSFYLSVLDHPAAANRKVWPFYFLAVVLTWTVVASLIPSSRSGAGDQVAPETSGGHE